MLNAILTKIVGSRNERLLKELRPIVGQINALEPGVQTLSDDQLRAKQGEFRQRVARGETLDALLPEAFAVVREAGRRTLAMRHFDVQLVGGMVLHRGMIAEMKTGEGKTLVATLPAYLNAMGGGGVHIVTVNDYLARRDAEWMGRIFRYLGLSVGCIQHDMDDRERQEAYGSDITYGTNNELGFDYLRDNMKFSLGAMVQRDHAFAIVDEVDSILIDEARTPLIISGPAEESTDKYYRIDKIIPKLQAGAVTQGGKDYEVDDTGDYVVDEKARTVTLTERGVEHCQHLLGLENLYDPAHMDLVHHINQALKAHVLFKRDVDYMLKDGEVVIVDEFTGRLMPGRRWSDGLHQAVEAKEGVKIERENQTLATITFQNYFRMYSKLSGMTGTADTEAVEFDKIYNLEVAVVPTNRPLIRVENSDVVYRTEDEKWRAVVEEIDTAQKRGQPSLVGTVSIEKSERLSALLKRKGVKHVVLNAKYHAQEAEIVAQAGRVGAVTIATNMAGRGTDILLGGNPEYRARHELLAAGLKPGETPPEEWDAAYAAALERLREECRREHDRVVELGGLYIIGTERHESRRIDNQLRGRAGRQGDPGASRFFLSLDDDLMRIFAGDRLKAAMKRLGMEEDVPIESGMVSRAIERAQKQVEQRNFEVRKHLLEYDDVNNKQRTEIYRLRRELLEGKEQKAYVLGKAREILDALVTEHLGVHDRPADWAIEPFRQQLRHFFGLDLETEGIELTELGLDEVGERVGARLLERYEQKETVVGVELMRQYERHLLLQIIDGAWKDHLLTMDHLKEGIGLRAYGQRDPLVEYKKESFDVFAAMKERIENDAVRFLFLLEPMTNEDREREEQRRRREQEQVFAAASRSAAGVTAKGGVETVARKTPKVGRNDPCPCGSGKKFKKCHGAGAPVAAS
ncbi:MAG TPA: preprotein translocase subunit SecA [Candidatus Polarisedimenticolaceae bacterium]|nr:preprotein translocase subunit SecA [Candidatus Polarisedimenticolaceae bacterium]